MNGDLRTKLKEATVGACYRVTDARFYQTERGFQGQFLFALQTELHGMGILDRGAVLEQEYQKSARHRMSQRPDIVLHVPAELSGSSVDAGNMAVWALKRRASRRSAQDDFVKLDSMMERLCYRTAFFINIDAADTMRGCYRGLYPDQVVAICVRLQGGVVRVDCS